MASRTDDFPAPSGPSNEINVPFTMVSSFCFLLFILPKGKGKILYFRRENFQVIFVFPFCYNVLIRVLGDNLSCLNLRIFWLSFWDPAFFRLGSISWSFPFTSMKEELQGLP